MKFFFASIIFFLFSSAGFGQKWIYISDDDKGVKHYYDSNIIVRDNNITEVWFKEGPPIEKLEQYRHDLIARRKNKSLPITGYEYYSYSITKQIFDCKQRKMKEYVAFYDYSDKGAVIFSASFDEAKVKWEDIVPESVGEKILSTVCKH